MIRKWFPELFGTVETPTIGLCMSCNRVTTHTTSFGFYDSDASAVTLHHCAECAEREIGEFLQLRRQFEFLRANGVSRERANEIMCERVERLSK